ncbi:acyl carrier protein [Larkinella soli]|uniref:acyl carrier protein n=1 Tax=Larkinella soli TaxID=1770527 RepID=UPI0013E37D45|nr:acyl carrier protein [Larkinella soli]
MEEWLVQQLAKELRVEASAIDPHRAITSYRLDSVVVVTLAVDLEEWLGVAIDPSIFWEFQTIADISHWLVNDYLPTQSRP